jgi:hypothetical protein
MGVGTADGIRYKAEWAIDKFKDPDNSKCEALRAGADVLDCEPYAHEEIDGNLALNEGLQLLIDLIAGTGSGTAWNNASAYLGVGESSTAAGATQTGLQGSTKTYIAMDATYPQRSSQTCTWRSTFGSADANINWYEYTVVNASTDAGVNLNRKVEDKGTKASGETWTLSLAITFS